MSNSTVQFVTQMKLRELHRQRRKLREAYQRLDAEVAQASQPGDRLRRLYAGLRELTFAGQPLHPEIVNLEILLYEIESGTLSPAVLSLWLQRLEDELAAGRLRAEFVYLFGALLEEWARNPSNARLLAESQQARDRLLHAALAELKPNRHGQVLDPLFDDLGPALAGLRQRLPELCRKGLRDSLGVSELESVLAALGKDIYRPAGLRREAHRFQVNAQLRKELGDALTILLADLHTWTWPPEGVATRALWTRNRWRLYLEEDLPTACLLEVLGRRWLDVLSRLIGGRGTVAERRNRLKKLLDLNAPEVIVENDRRMLRLAEQMTNLEFFEEEDLWEPGRSVDFDQAEAGSIVQMRVQHQQLLLRLNAAMGYGEDYGANTGQVVQLLQAEVELARAAFPDRPLHVVKVDLQDYYASIPHDVLLTLLQKLGAPSAEVAFFADFLAPPLRRDGQAPAKMVRGVPMNHTLSGLLAELLLRLLDRHVSRHARVRIIRLVDDICLLTPDAAAAVSAWRRIEEFCTTCGLQVNREKCGAVCLGGVSPGELPEGRPRWGMLELDENGRWLVHRPTFEAHLDQTRQRLAAAEPILSRVQLYNANAQYLTASLALGAALGESHRETTTQAVCDFHRAFFGGDRGIVAELCQTLRERFPLDAPDIPESWVYWPLTAGGLALQNPLVVAGQFMEGYRRREKATPPRTRPADWDHKANDWSEYYRKLLLPVDAIDPKDTKVMKALVDDFIQRGSAISSGRQQSLSSYWRWVVYTYGPQILQRFGTFRFLITELVPLQLISQQRLQDSSLDEARPGAPANGRDEEDTAV